MDQETKEVLIERITTIGKILEESEVPYTPITALALNELSIQIIAEKFQISLKEARIRTIHAMLEMLRNHLEADSDA